MDIVVYLALGVLTAVFLVSLLVLIVMCQRRRVHLKNLTMRSNSLRFSRLQNENAEGIVHLSPLMAQVLDKNSWVWDVGGVLQHCVALLRLCHTICEKLASVPLVGVPQTVNDVLCEGAGRVMPRFDDLLSATASPTIDVRVLEARATSLATVCWALFVPFTLINPKYKEVLGEPLAEMDQHLDALRQAAEIAERAEMARVEIDWSKLDVVGAAGGGASSTGAGAVIHTEHIKHGKKNMSEQPLLSETDDVCTNTNEKTSKTVEEEPLVNGHPIDPAV